MDLKLDNNEEEILYEDFYLFINKHNFELEHIKNQYIELMTELTKCENLTNQVFYNKIQNINSMGKIIIAYKNKILPEIIGSGTIIIEPKIIRGGKSVGHIEDIVVKSSHRGKKIAQTILDKLKTFAKSSDCYKVILDCDDSVSKVYKSNGFELKGVQMGMYF